MEITFLDWEELLELHEDQLRRWGGQNSLIDEGVVRSVLSRSKFTWQYKPEADVADLAADYRYGLATPQGFMDGNKRTAVVATLTFLEHNGWDVTFTDKLLFVVALAVAKGDLDRDGLADILRTHMEPLEDQEI